MRGHSGVDVRHTLGTGHSPREDSDDGGSSDQRTSIVSGAGSHASLVVRAKVLVLDARPVAQAVSQAAGRVGDGRHLQPLHDIGMVAGVLEGKRGLVGNPHHLELS